MIPSNENQSFDSKTISSTVAIIGTLVRVWEDTPHQAIVPCVDENGSRFELVFEHTRKAMFDEIVDHLPRTEHGEAFLSVSGVWNKRMWRKTRSQTGGWGHTWQMFVAEASYTDANGHTQTIGEIPQQAAA